MTHIVRAIADLRTQVSVWHQDGLKVALVPTMGALHAGHLSLVKHALEQADRCVLSLFVNPAQFAPQEDFDTYPRREAEDVAKFLDAGGHLVFAPSVAELYPSGHATKIAMSGPALGLEQAFRPALFDGVVLVVTKLLLAAQAEIAVFGEKDYQQLKIVERLVSDLFIPTKIVASPIVRDAEGLALSSRNAYLSAAELLIARNLNTVLTTVARKLKTIPGETHATLFAARQELSDIGFDSVDYLEPRSPDLQMWEQGGEGRLLAAVQLGSTRLIDNVEI